MSKSVRTVVVLLIVAAIVGVSWWQLRQLRAQSAEATGAGSSHTLTLYPGNKGVPAPDVAGPTLDDKQLGLKDLRGHVVVLNVWGSWCRPCRLEAPDLARVSRETRPDGVRFLGIDTRDNVPAARAFTRRFQIDYPSLEDPTGVLLAQFAGIVPVSAVPSTLVIDAEGLIRARVIGRVDATTLRGLIEDAE